MALFGSKRDSRFVKQINKELYYRVVDTEVLYYKIVMESTKTNIYGEGIDKLYYQPVRFPIFIDRQNTETTNLEFGLDTSANITFYIFKDTALTLNLLPEQGDLIQWDSKFYELDNVSENKYWVGKNPASWIKGDNHGLSLNYECNGHMIRESQIQVLDVDYGANLDEYSPNI